MKICMGFETTTAIACFRCLSKKSWRKMQQNSCFHRNCLSWIHTIRKFSLSGFRFVVANAYAIPSSESNLFIFNDKLVYIQYQLHRLIYRIRMWTCSCVWKPRLRRRNNCKTFETNNGRNEWNSWTWKKNGNIMKKLSYEERLGFKITRVLCRYAHQTIKLAIPVQLCYLNERLAYRCFGGFHIISNRRQICNCGRNYYSLVFVLIQMCVRKKYFGKIGLSKIENSISIVYFRMWRGNVPLEVPVN